MSPTRVTAVSRVSYMYLQDNQTEHPTFHIKESCFIIMSTLSRNSFSGIVQSEKSIAVPSYPLLVLCISTSK